MTKQTAKWTPGPWKCTGEETSKCVETIRDNQGRWLADCVTTNGPLIALSPDWPAIVDGALRALETRDTVQMIFAESQLRSLLAKLEGGR